MSTDDSRASAAPLTIDHLSQVIRDAEMPGDVVEPAALLNALATVDNPISALSDRDQATNLFAAFDGEFGFIRRTRATKTPIQPHELSRWASLIRWFIRELITWDHSKDPTSRTLVAIFVVAQACDWANVLWELMPAQIGLNSDLIQCLKGLINSFSVTFTSRGGVAEPIWEREAVEKFQIADAQGDWAEIGNDLRSLEHQIFPNILLNSVSPMPPSMRHESSCRCAGEFAPDGCRDASGKHVANRSASQPSGCKR